jgi:predicted ATPase/DNA-binding XRE family transcriptional regulator
MKVVKSGASQSFGAQLKALREAAAFTQEELATIAGLSVHAVSALERGQRRRPHPETIRALSAALDLTGPVRDALFGSARIPGADTSVAELSSVPLPLAPTALLGRDADLQTLREWFADPAARLITLSGPGGVGKTRLALEVARAIAAEGGTRVVFVPLSAIRDPGFVGLAIADAFGLSDVTPVELTARARVACGDNPTLLVLDNFEQVLDAVPLAVNLLSSIPTLRLLATSRSPLHVRGEREYVVGPLALEDTDAQSPAELARSPAVRLFVDRVRDVRAGFRLTAANAPVVAAICRRLDALPLALELAAPWLKVLTPEDLLRRLEDDVLLSTIAPRDVPERQQTIGATVAWSYQLLSPDEQRAFRRLGALPGRFPIEAAAAVLGDREGHPASTDDALRVVVGLIDKSLLLRAETAAATRPIYRMLQLVRTYAAHELAAASEREDALEGLSRYCIGEASRATDGLTGPRQAEWLDRVRDDLENHRGTLAWLIERGRAADACQIASGLMFFWIIRGRAAEGLQWYERLLNVPLHPPAVEQRALVGAAVMSYMQGDLPRVRAGLARALALAHDEADPSAVAQAENLLGHVEHAVGNAAAAREHFTRSVEHFRALAIPWGTGNALLGMASVALTAGDIDEAQRLLDEATAVMRQAGPWFLNLPLYVRAILAVRSGNPDQAIAFVRETLTCSWALRDKFAFVYALAPLAAAAVIKGEHTWAARILGARDAVIERTGARVADHSIQDFRTNTERESRERLGSDRWARAYAAGRQTTIEALLRDIDRVAGKQ